MKKTRLGLTGRMVTVACCLLLLSGCLGNPFAKKGGKDDKAAKTEKQDKKQVTETREKTPVEVDEETPAAQEKGLTPALMAIKAGSDGGEFRQLESGEVVYIYPISEIFARNVWVEDTDGTVYYMDVSGCRMPSNQTPDGYFTDTRGAWDQQREPVRQSMSPTAMNHVYNDTREGMEGDQWTFRVNGDGTGTANHRYSFGSEENFNCSLSGLNTFTLIRENDDFVQCHVVLLEQGRQVRISGGGASKTYYAEN